MTDNGRRGVKAAAAQDVVD